MHDSSQRRVPRWSSRGCQRGGCWRGQVSNTQFGKQRALISTTRTTCACQLAGICEELPNPCLSPRTLSCAHTHTHTRTHIKLLPLCVDKLLTASAAAAASASASTSTSNKLILGIFCRILICFYIYIP